MRVLLLNGSPKEDGSTATALDEVAREIEAAGLETERFELGTKMVRGCTGCLTCRSIGCCRYYDDRCNDFVKRAKEADGFIFGSPVYYAGPNGALCALLDRAFYSSTAVFAGKPGAAVVACRRGGAASAFDRLNKYFTIAQMPVVSSWYWNSVHGNNAEEVRQDAEGLQVMRVLGRNMAHLLKLIAAGEAAGLTAPEEEAARERTNFIR